MIKQLTLQGLRADLGQARIMLAAAINARDIVATLQFERRVDDIEKRIAELSVIDERIASVALFFGGKPVVGSRGVDVEFASKAIDSFQRLLSRQFSRMENGELGMRGRLPAQDEARMIVTDVARGSVGFVLEEAPEQGQLVETQLRAALNEVTVSVSKLSGENDEWADVLEGMDDRVTAEIKQFFAILDDAGASVRIVEGENDREISQVAIHRARSRVDLTKVSQEDSLWVKGQLVGFTSKTFEFLTENGDRLSGRLASGPAKQIDKAGRDRDIQRWVYTPVSAQFTVRTVSNGAWSRSYYTLIAIDDR